MNRFPHSTVISERRGSRDEREKRAYYRQKEKEDYKDGNEHRRLSTGEKIDLDFLRTIANRSSQTSPSNVQIVTVEERYGAQSSNTNTEVIEKVPLQENDGMRCEESKKNEEEAIAEKADAGKEHVSNYPVESYADVKPRENENGSSTYKHSPMVDDNTEDGDHSNVEGLDTDTQNVTKRFKQENDDKSVKSDGNQKFSEFSVGFDEEQSKISSTVEEVPKKQEGGEILEKHEGEEEVEDYNREKQRLGHKEDEQVPTPDQDSQQNDEKRQQPEERDNQIPVCEEQGDKDKERKHMEETVKETTIEKSSPCGQRNVTARDEYTQGISSRNNNNIRNSEALGL